MRTFRTVALVLSIAFSLLDSVLAAQPLPDAGSFVVSVREDSANSLPLGPACGGEAALTLTCRAFVISLKNVGVHTVHLSRIACQEPVVTFEMKDPNSTSGWWPISQVSRPRCTPWNYENLRLRPGETTEYKTRLVAQNRQAEAPIAPRSYTVRIHWMLWGCTEEPEGTDCLAPLQVMEVNPAWGDLPPIGEVERQPWVDIVSKEIEVNSPTIPDLGPLKLGFEISVASEQQAAELRKRIGARCATDPGNSMECTVFHYAIRNLGDRPVRNGRFTCSDDSIIPEYRTNDGEWKQLQSRLMACNSNVYFETPILPGHTAEGDFTLGTLAPQFDTSPLYPNGKYEIRVHFQSSVCFASPDGSFDIQCPKEQTETISNVIRINATAFTANTSSTK